MRKASKLSLAAAAVLALATMAPAVFACPQHVSFQSQTVTPINTVSDLQMNNVGLMYGQTMPATRVVDQAVILPNTMMTPSMPVIIEPAFGGGIFR
jgi:hypothetical protein